MPGLSSLVALHHAVLLIDSASARVQAGLWRPTGPAVWRQSEQEPSVAIFECVDALLTETGTGMHAIGAFVFCEGPGSILGIRTAAMALRTWQALAQQAPPAYAYRSLELAACALRGDGTRLPFAVIADARRNAWHWVEVGMDGTVRPLQRVPSSTLTDFAGDLFMPAGFRVWTPLPRMVREASYSLPSLWRRHGETDLLHSAPAPDAFLHEDSSYASWTPQIHRAPSQATT
ncbi:MAG: peptidase M22 [Opitutaceae bacterium]|nr:peptidase M22 [Opitutaceae bacterium]